MNFIKDVLGEILFKKQKKDLLNNQSIVANSISKNRLNHLQKEINNNNFNIKNENEISLDLFHKIRGIYDFKALNQRYKDKKIYDYYCPTQQTRKKLFEIISIARCLKLGFEEFIGCKKNIQKSLKNPNIFFDLFGFNLKVIDSLLLLIFLYLAFLKSNSLDNLLTISFTVTTCLTLGAKLKDSNSPLFSKVLCMSNI